ncbi:MAG: hypothetical protein QOI74_3289 [Micromonosporaceae bacterium]|jgi:hypothetical protein|nr:hypothetical protein [Micromonosporaceae bacterium]
MSAPQIVTIIAVIVVLVLVIGAAWAMTRRRSLRRRFGPEYHRAIAEHGGRRAGERELRARQRRHADLDLRPLSPDSRAAYAASWEEIQVRFVDAPGEAVSDADALITGLIADRGYPTGDYAEQLAHLSVEHGSAVAAYRDAHETSVRSGRDEIGTEQLRQAMVGYRALVVDLLGEQPTPPRTPSADPESVQPDRAVTVPPAGEGSSDARQE